MSTYNQLIHEYRNKFYDKGLSPETVKAFIFELCNEFGINLYLEIDNQVDKELYEKFEKGIIRLLDGEPLNYVLGYSYFYGYRFIVNPDVLIPRPETEEMVEYLAATAHRSVTNVLDLCTGSGCIAIALKKLLPGSNVVAVDISADALRIAQANAEKNCTGVEFVLGDVLQGAPLPISSDGWNLIVSNPPYITLSEKGSMCRNVLDYEPQLALFVPDNDPLLFYRKITAFAQQNLSPDGLLAMEINERFGQETLQMLRDYGFTGELHKDFRGKDRFITAVLSSR